MDKTKKEEILLKNNLSTIIQWVHNVDSKASILLGLISLIIAFCLNFDFIKKPLKFLIVTTKNINRLNFELFFSIVAWISIICILFFLFKVIWKLISTLKGRIEPTIYNENGLTTKSLLFFETIQNRKFIEFKTEYDEINEEQLNNDLLSQIYINSKICSKKFEEYNIAIKNFINFLISFFIAFVSIFIIYIIK